MVGPHDYKGGQGPAGTKVPNPNAGWGTPGFVGKSSNRQPGIEKSNVNHNPNPTPIMTPSTGQTKGPAGMGSIPKDTGFISSSNKQSQGPAGIHNITSWDSNRNKKGTTIQLDDTTTGNTQENNFGYMDEFSSSGTGQSFGPAGMGLAGQTGDPFATGWKKAEEEEEEQIKKELEEIANNQMGSPKIDTDNEYLTTELYPTVKEIIKILGLDPKNKRHLQVALNFLDKEQLESMTDYQFNKYFGNLTADQLREIKTIRGDKNINDKDIYGDTGAGNKNWKTWGTGLRGDMRMTGYSADKSKYTQDLDILAGDWEAGSNIWKYHRALVEANKPLRGKDVIGSIIMGAFGLLTGGPMGLVAAAASAKPKETKTLLSTLKNNLMKESTTLDKDKGIFSLAKYGDQYDINADQHFSKFDINSANRALNDEKDEPYNAYAYNTDTTGVIDEDEEDENNEDIVTDYTSNNPAWWDWNLFEAMFGIPRRLQSATEDEEGEVQQAKQGGIVRKR